MKDCMLDKRKICDRDKVNIKMNDKKFSAKKYCRIFK